MPKKRKDKTSAELKKEEKERKLAAAKKLAREINMLYGTIKNRLFVAEKSGNIPDEAVIRGYRKNLQFLSSGLRKLRRTKVVASFNQGHVNILIMKLNKWLAGDVAATDTAKTAKDKGQEIDEILNRIRLGAGTIADPAVHDAIVLLREIAKKKIMTKEALMVAKRASKLMHQRRKSEGEIENFLKDKFVEPVLSAVFTAFMSKLEILNVGLDKDVRNYIETCVKGGKSRKEFINLLLERQTAFTP